MATKNFTQFSTTTLTTGDYIVGYKENGSTEIKTQVQDIVNLVGESDSQTLSFNEITKDLSISSGNTVSLSAFVEEAPVDGVIYGRKDADWFDITEPANLQIRRGTAAEVTSITPLEGEPVWETNTKKLKVGDGVTSGGIDIGPRTFVQQIITVNTSSIILPAARTFEGVYESYGTTCNIDLPTTGNQAGDTFLITLRVMVGSPTIALRKANISIGDNDWIFGALGSITSGTRTFQVRNSNGIATGWYVVPPSLTIPTDGTTINNVTNVETLSARFNDLLGELRRLGLIGGS